jgi:hypothetical protein
LRLTELFNTLPPNPFSENWWVKRAGRNRKRRYRRSSGKMENGRMENGEWRIWRVVDGNFKK